MFLRQVQIPGKQGNFQLELKGEYIYEIKPDEDSSNTHSPSFNLSGCSVYPGLINSHDHLDFNNFPSLRSGIYKNYRDWGRNIHIQFKEEINQVLKIPVSLRLYWGLYKNLINGFTTVVNHGPGIDTDERLISVFQDNYVLHSPAFEKNWKWKLNRPLRKRMPFVMHVGEGTDKYAAEEISDVSNSNLWKRKLIAVHGVAMQREQAKKYSGLVWCPASNYFLLGETTRVNQLRNETVVVFGTDSTLTGSWNAWEHFRIAIASDQISQEDLLSALTVYPANLWKMKDRGIIDVNKRADLMVVRNNKTTVFASNPEDILLVMHRGQLRLLDESILHNSGLYEMKGFSRIKISNAVKWIQGDLPVLVKNIKRYYPAAEFPFEIV